MSLFLFDEPQNLLPFDGEAIYFGRIFSIADSDKLLEQLLSGIAWQNDRAVIYGKEYITKRKVAWYAVKPYSYTYSNTTKTALPFTDLLKYILSVVAEHTGEAYNSCLLNLYHTGEEGMAWHSDAEKEIRRHGSIASVSFGAERKFAFKHKKTGEVRTLLLENGSLLEMRGVTQDNWLHRLPPTKKIQTARVNLTFRQMNE